VCPDIGQYRTLRPGNKVRFVWAPPGAREWLIWVHYAGLVNANGLYPNDGFRT
jgi:hypothetical protein